MSYEETLGAFVDVINAVGTSGLQAIMEQNKGPLTIDKVERIIAKGHQYWLTWWTGYLACKRFVAKTGQARPADQETDSK